jgi:hypothetical protein
VIWAKLAFGGLGRRGLQAVVALAVLAVAVAIMAGALMVVEGARNALARAERGDRPDIVQIKSRFNRAVFETPRSGYLPPLMIPVYEPLIDPAKLGSAGGLVVARQSFLRNVVSGDSFLNLYIFGIEPEKEAKQSTFSVANWPFPAVGRRRCRRSGSSLGARPRARHRRIVPGSQSRRQRLEAHRRRHP